MIDERKRKEKREKSKSKQAISRNAWPRATAALRPHLRIQEQDGADLGDSSGDLGQIGLRRSCLELQSWLDSFEREG